MGFIFINIHGREDDRDTWRIILAEESMAILPWTCPISSEEKYIVRNITRLDEANSTKRKEVFGSPQILQAASRLRKLLQLQTCAILHEKGKITWRVEIRTQKVEPRATEDYFQTLSPNLGNVNLCITEYQNCSRPVTLVWLPIPPFWRRMSA